MRNFVQMIGKNGIKAVQEAASSAFYNKTCKLQTVNIGYSRLRPSMLFCPSIRTTHFSPSQISKPQQVPVLWKCSQYALPLISPSTRTSNRVDYDFDQKHVASNSHKIEVQLPFFQSVLFHPTMDLIELNFSMKLHSYNVCTSYSINQETKLMEQFRTKCSSILLKRCQINSNTTAFREPIRDLINSYYCMNRNKRRGKRANKGKRPCSHQHRRKRRRRFGSHRR